MSEKTKDTVREHFYCTHKMFRTQFDLYYLIYNILLTLLINTSRTEEKKSNAFLTIHVKSVSSSSPSSLFDQVLGVELYLKAKSQKSIKINVA